VYPRGDMLMWCLDTGQLSKNSFASSETWSFEGNGHEPNKEDGSGKTHVHGQWRVVFGEIICFCQGQPQTSLDPFLSPSDQSSGRKMASRDPGSGSWLAFRCPVTRLTKKRHPLSMSQSQAGASQILPLQITHAMLYIQSLHTPDISEILEY
jgi:hypothetical protein